MRSLPNPLVIRTNLYAFWSYAGLLKGVPRKKNIAWSVLLALIKSPCSQFLLT